MDLITRDINSIWHPCSQMKDYETFLPMSVKRAKGSYLFLKDGTKVLDAISSWWCKSLGHGHPALTQALIRQAKKFENVILANTTNDIIVALSEKLKQISSLDKIFYASDGACAVEIALKMSIHARQIRGQPTKNQIVALANGYHGETLLALAVSDLGLYRMPYEAYVPKIEFIQNIPYVCSKDDSTWIDASLDWARTEQQLNHYQDSISAIIVEPIVQGAAGMRIYSADFLNRLRTWCTLHDVYLIVDEIMTGFGRTGKMFAYEYADILPDFLCVGKALTSGYLPMSAVLTTDEVYQLFYDDYSTNKSFLHSHTYSGNALAVAVALESLRVIVEENILTQAVNLESLLLNLMTEVATKTNKLQHIRVIGGIVAADLIVSDNQSRVGYEVYRKAVSLGALLRPIGNTIYWFPPLNIKENELCRLRDITIAAINTVLGSTSSVSYHCAKEKNTFGNCCHCEI